MTSRVRSLTALPTLMLLLAPAFARADSLADFLSSARWEGSKVGPMIVMQPEKVTCTGRGADLGDYKRKLFHLKTLSVIAPTAMVLIDDSFSQPVNLYDGLPRNAKVLYLLSTLSQDQMSKATSKGISYGDLSTEQRAVMVSIMPKQLVWNAYKDDQSETQTHVDGGVISGQDLEGVKLKFVRDLVFSTDLAAGKGYTQHSASEWNGPPGKTYYLRDDRSDFDQDEAFGLKARQVVDNSPKPSQVAYGAAAWDALVGIGGTQTVSQLLSAISKATGLEFHADLRVADREVETSGASARAGDLAEAIALAVTGTYRKVGQAYILTSDLEGMGARKVKFALWSDSMQNLVQERDAAWRAAIGKSGKIASIKGDPNSAIQPNDAMADQLTLDETTWSSERIPTSTMPDSVNQFLQHVNKSYPTQQIATSSVGLHSDLRYEFVLPNGQALKPEIRNLGSPISFRASAGTQLKGAQGSLIPDFGKLPYSVAKAKGLVPALIQATDRRSLMDGLDLVAKHGFSEVWIDVADPTLFKAGLDQAKSLGLKVRLAIRPWAAPAGTKAADLDQTILGETALQVAVRRSTMTAKSLGGGMGPVDSLGYDIVAPGARSTYSRFATFTQMAKVTGVEGVVVLDSQPQGYEDRHVNFVTGGVNKLYEEVSDFGYTVEQRLAFIRKESLDPIDIMNERLHADVDLRQPFFFDDALRASSTVYDGSDDTDPRMRTAPLEWDKFRATTQSTALATLLGALPQTLPSGILVEPRRVAENIELIFRQFAPWSASSPFPTNPEQPSYNPIFKGPILLPIAETDDPTELAELSFLLTRGGVDAALDFRKIPADRLTALMDHLFTRVMAIK